jgi:hypothetical protein
VATRTEWASRIVGTGEESPAELRANPHNYRRHPGYQEDALREMLDEVGWVQQVIVNRRTGNLVDGHLRVELAEKQGEETVPVLYVELTEDEERLVLAAFDPIGALAEPDPQALDSLLASVQVNGEALQAMLADLAPVAPPEEEPKNVADYLEAMKVSLGDPEHRTETGEVWRVGEAHYLAVVSVYDGWPTYAPLLEGDRLLIPYPTPVIPLTQRARNNELVMVQPDTWLAGHLLDKYAEVHGPEAVALR